LVSGHSRLFGLIVEDITNPFFPELIQGFEELAVEHGYEILVSSTNNILGRLTTCVRRMLERKVEGVAVMTFGQEEPVLDDLINRNIPLVLAEFKVDNPKISTILLDYMTGIRQGVEHLKQLGHQRIGFISGPHTLHSANTRRQAFLTSLKQAGLPVTAGTVIEGDHTLDGGIRAFEIMLQSGALPTAIMCSNDTTAIGVLRAAYHTGLRVPEDLSLIGLDDIHFAEFTLPPLTTVRLSRAELAEAAFTALRKMAEPEESGKPQREFLVSTSLVVRGSTAAPRK
jgi:LacI family transcriptional regulator